MSASPKIRDVNQRSMDDQHMAEAETWIKRAMDFNTKHNTKWELAHDHALYANWFKKKGDIQGAKEQLTKAIDLFRECGADGWVSRTEKPWLRLRNVKIPENLPVMTPSGMGAEVRRKAGRSGICIFPDSPPSPGRTEIFRDVTSEIRNS